MGSEWYQLDPLLDPRWTNLVERSPMSSIFHCRAWLHALQRTYGYEPVVFTTTPPGQPLRDGWVFCRINSWMTGRRLVSLPFSDHCAPLAAGVEPATLLLDALKDSANQQGRYIEVRSPVDIPMPGGYEKSASFEWQVIDLRPELDVVFNRLHRSHTRRSIKKAARVGVTIARGNSAGLLDEFYALHTMTRVRHGQPVQPARWFEALAGAFGDGLCVYMAMVSGRPIAAILTLRYGCSFVYKYGGSDVAYNRLAATPALFWEAIKDGKAAGCPELDLGRSDADDAGLIAFKDHLGARRTTLNYYRLSAIPRNVRHSKWSRVLQQVYRGAPRSVQLRVGSGLYRHFG